MDLEFPTHTVTGSELDIEASATNGSASVSLDPAYKGDFELYGRLTGGTSFKFRINKKTKFVTRQIRDWRSWGESSRRSLDPRVLKAESL